MAFVGGGAGPSSGATRPRPPRTDAAHERYQQNRPQPYDERQRFYHTTEAPEHRSLQEHAQSFRDKGIIGSEHSSFGEGKQVFSHPAPPREMGPRQMYVEFEPGRRPSGSGTSFMGRGGASTAKSFAGDVPPERVHGVYGHMPGGGIGRLADAGSTLTGLAGLIGAAASFIPGYQEHTPYWIQHLNNGGPMGDALQYVIDQNYGPGGIMDPYKNQQGTPGFNPATGQTMA